MAQTYYAKSLFSSKTFWLNTVAGLVEILQITDVLAIFPPGWMQYRLAIVGVLNIIVRRFTVRPAAFSLAPGETKPVSVPTV